MAPSSLQQPGRTSTRNQHELGTTRLPNFARSRSRSWSSVGALHLQQHHFARLYSRDHCTVIPIARRLGTFPGPCNDPHFAKMTEITTLDALQSLHGDLVAIREGRPYGLDFDDSGPALRVFERELEKFWDPPPRNESNRNAVKSGTSAFLCDACQRKLIYANRQHYY
jgi:hypothetical protein